jgi:subtilisin family serine protease
MFMQRPLRALRALTAGLFIATATLAIAPAAVAASAVPSAVAQKLSEGSDGLAALWSDGARLPIIVEFAMPAIPDTTNFDGPEAADDAHTQAIRAAQDAILGNLLGSPADIAGAEASTETGLKRMDFSPMFGMVASAEEVEKLSADPRVVRIHEDGLSDPSLIQSLPLIGMPTAYTMGATGNNYRVAVLDTGGRRSHEFLSQQIVSAACYSTTNAQAQSTSICPGGASESISLDSANDCDAGTIFGCGHGTHVAGTAAGFNTNQQAGEPAHGVARNGRIISINVFSRFAVPACGNIPAQYTGGCVRAFNTDQIKGLERVYALRNAMNIAAVNMSLGGGQHFTNCDGDARKPIIDLLRNANIATVIAAGNDGFDGSVGAPACISTAITVASSTKQDVRSGFSNWGSMIDLVAPGSGILASYVSGTSNTHYASLSGTSMATPHVAGVWAAIRTVRPNSTVSQIETALKNTGLNISSAGTTKPRVRVPQALEALGITVPGPANDNFANRINIPSPATVTGSNVGATAETGEPIHAGRTSARNSVWWRFTPSASGSVTINTFGSNFDTVLAVYTGSSVSSLTEVASNDDFNGLQSQVSFQGTAGTSYAIAVAGFGGAEGNISLTVQASGGGNTTNIVAAVTPVTRATQVNSTVTAFATVINSGSVAATSCSVAVPGGNPLTFSYRSRNHLTGALGTVNQPVNIAAGARQDFLMAFTPTGAMQQELALVFDCTNTPPAPSVVGLNTFLLIGTTSAPPADILSIAETATQDGIMNIPLGGTGFAALAAMNIGASAQIQARLSASSILSTASTLPNTTAMVICRTNPTTGACLATPTATVNFTPGTNEIVTFTAFVASNGTPIPFNPASTRLFVHFFQGSTPVGSASVAARTVAPPPDPAPGQAAALLD